MKKTLQAEAKLSERLKELNVLYRIHSHTIMARPLSRVLSDVARDLACGFQFPALVQVRIVFDGNCYQSSPQKVRFYHALKQPILIGGVERGLISVGYFKKVPPTSRLSSSLSPFLSEENKLLKALATVLSRHIRSREEIELHQKIVHTSFTSLCIVINGLLDYANPQFFTLFKCRENRVIGFPLSDFIPDLSRINKLEKSSKTGCRYKTVCRHKNGPAIEAEILVQKARYHGKKALIVRFYDITCLKKAEARLIDFNVNLKKMIAEKTQHLKKANDRLQSLNNLKDEFMAIASHELRSPLTSIRGYLSFLVEQEALASIPQSMRQYIMRAYQHTESLTYLVNNILDVSRLNMDRFELQLTSVDLVKIIRGTIEGFAFQANEKQIALDFQSTAPAKLMMRLDAIRLAQVLRNLLDNAVKFSRRGQTITIRLSAKKSVAMIDVIDRGVGIPKTKLNRVFEKFVQVKNIHSRYKGGAGLGLFIVRKIVELHGGTITVTSQSGKGAIFSIHLPINN